MFLIVKLAIRISDSIAMQSMYAMKAMLSMSDALSPLEAHVLAYYVQGTATTLDITGRFYPHGELVMIITDKMQVATRKFGRKAGAATRAAATAFVDQMIAAGAWSTKTNDFGGTMHQFQGGVYRPTLKEMQANDPVIAAVGDTWEAVFEELTR
jgi:hypothetical protein